MDIDKIFNDWDFEEFSNEISTKFGAYSIGNKFNFHGDNTIITEPNNRTHIKCFIPIIKINDNYHSIVKNRHNFPNNKKYLVDIYAINGLYESMDEFIKKINNERNR